MEALSTIAALVAVFGVVLAKAVVTVRARLVQRQIAHAGQNREAALNNLRAVMAQKKIADANQSTLMQKKKRLEGKLKKLQAELSEYGSDEERRELQRERARGKLIRGPKAGTDDGDGDEGPDAADG